MILTVIIPTYNRAEFLPRAVASVLRTSCEAQLDILIVDDGSDDHTPDLCTDLMSRHAELRVVRQENTGVAGARNLGLRSLLPETDYVTFLDSDDVMAPDRFEHDLGLLQSEPNLLMTYGMIMQVTAIDDDTLAPAPESVRSVARMTHLSAGLYRRSLIADTGYFAEDMAQAEDTDFLFRMFEQGIQYRETDTIAAYYLRHAGNMTNDRALSEKCTRIAMMRAIKRRRDEPWRSKQQPEMRGHMLPPPDAE